MKLTVYLLSGLGADDRLFGFVDLSDCNVIPIKWLKPEKTESISAFARRLLPQITDPDPVLIGVSFGGMMAIEIGKLIHTKKIILISSSPSSDYIPSLYKFAGRLKFTRLFSGTVMKKSHRLMNWFFGVSGNAYRKLLVDMLKDSDPDFLEWAIERVVTWENVTIPSNVVRIHGTNDVVLPVRGADVKIKGAGHLMVAERASEVSDFIHSQLGAI